MTVTQAVNVPRPNCPYCKDTIPFGEEPVMCPQCHAPHHAECVQELGGACGACAALHPRFAAPRSAPPAPRGAGPRPRAALERDRGAAWPAGPLDLSDVLLDRDVEPGSTLHFVARDAGGSVRRGELVADSVTAAVRQLADQGLTPLALGLHPTTPQAVFLYTAVDAAGRRVGGWLAASSRDHAVAALDQAELTPTRVRQVATQDSALWGWVSVGLLAFAGLVAASLALALLLG